MGAPGEVPWTDLSQITIKNVGNAAQVAQPVFQIGALNGAGQGGGTGEVRIENLRIEGQGTPGVFITDAEKVSLRESTFDGVFSAYAMRFGEPERAVTDLQLESLQIMANPDAERADGSLGVSAFGVLRSHGQ